MIVGIIGSGGREHAICNSLRNSKKVKNIYCIPGNAGTARITNSAKIKKLNPIEILNFCKIKKIGMVIPGSEEYLEQGISDFLKLDGISVIGPGKYAALLETSKYFTKKICELSGINTAKWALYKNANDAKKIIKTKKFPLVIKMDSLAAGKGVLVAKTVKEAINFLNNIIKGMLGNSKSKIIIEECLIGEEASFFFAVDGVNAKFIGSAKDYKRIGEGNTGLNTGGMGCISPAPKETKKVINKILKEIINPTLKTMKNLGHPYYGFLYAGVMFTNKGIFLIEYNVRLGDPECQSVLSRLKTNFYEICNQMEKRKIKELNIVKNKLVSSCIVLASRGYPEKYKKNIKIFGLGSFKNNKKVKIFHAGTLKNNKGDLVTNGGRVLNIIGTGKSLQLALRNSYEACNKISWEGNIYRKDIGS